MNDSTPDSPQADQTAALPVRVPVESFLSGLKVLLGGGGPFVSFFLPVHDDASRHASADAINSMESLSAEQQSFGCSLLDSERVGDDAMVVGFIAADGTSFEQSFPEGPDAPVVEVGQLPRLGPVLEAEQRLRHHVLAIVSDEGIDVLTFPRHGQATLHRAAPGDASYAALLIAEAAKQTETPLVLIAGEHAEDLAARVVLDVPIETRVQAVDSTLDVDSLADVAVRRVATDRANEAVQAIRAWKFERAHGLTAGGVQASLDALRGDDARMVLVTDAVDDNRQAWFGSEPSEVALDLQDASSAEEIDTELLPARLVDVVLRSALLRDIPVTVVPDLPDETLRDGVGVIRSTVVPS